jgi:hypothetical protein
VLLPGKRASPPIGRTLNADREPVPEAIKARAENLAQPRRAGAACERPLDCEVLPLPLLGGVV